MKKEPKIFPINELPIFVQQCAMKIWEEAGIKPENVTNIVFAYYDGIYTSFPITKDLFIHESVHYVRQGAGLNEDSAKAWWIAYTNDKKFRYDEELLAYRAQYQFIKKTENREVAFREAKRLASDLSGPIYGGIVSETDALFAIISK